jgi:hypothetical protein
MATRYRIPMRLAIGALALMLAATLAGCGGNGGTSSNGSTNGEAGGPGDEPGPTSILQTTVAIAAPPEPVAGGGTASVQVTSSAVGDPGLGAWEFDLVYDPDIVAVAECDSDAGQTVCNPEFGDDTIRFAGATGAGLTGDIVLATVGFTCEAAGASPLDLTVTLLADATIGAPRLMVPTVSSGQITCS